MGTPTDAPPQSALMQYLPAIYQSSDYPFLGQFLTAFENLLVATDEELAAADVGEAASQSLEATIAGVAALFDAQKTPAEFLPWLAGWAALTLRADVETNKQRTFLSQVIQLYRARGTKENLERLLRIFTGTTPSVDEDALPSIIYPWTPLNSAHFFRVTVPFAEDPDAATVARQTKIAQAVVEFEKPAHARHELVMDFPGLKIGERSAVGVDTLLGTARADARN